nr:hypothetical protein [Tanacetum cinerariifolium]
MVNTRTDVDLSMAVQNALQTLVPQIREEIREEFRTGSGSSNAGGNPTPISHMEKIFDVMGCEVAFKTRLAVYKFEAAGTEEEQAKNFQWGLRRQKSGDRHQPTTQQSSHRSHGYNNDRHGSDRRSGGDNHRSNNNYSGSNNRSSGNGRDQRNRGQQSNRYANSGSHQSRGPSEGYSYPVCTTCGRRHPGECHRAAGTCFKCGQAGHLQKDCKKNITASTSGQADKKPGASGRVFAITEGHAANTSARDALRSTNGDDSHNSETGVRRTKRATRECTYTDFLKCQPLPFKGTEGVASLS